MSNREKQTAKFTYNNIERTVEEGKTTFSNGRINRGTASPIKMTSYRNVYGSVVRYKNLPLKELKDGKLVDKMVPDPNSESGYRVELYGLHLDFTASRSITLDNFIHAEVIQAIRDAPSTVSSKKSENEPSVSTGSIIEYEPNVAVAKEFEDNDILFSVGDVISKMRLRSYKSLFLLLCSYFEIKAADNSVHPFKEKFNTFSKMFQGSTTSAQVLLDVVEKPNTSSGVYTKVVMREEIFNEAIVKMACEKQVIKVKQDGFYLGSVYLGPDMGLIYKNNMEKMARIRQELQKVIDFPLLKGREEKEQTETAK